MSKAVSVGDKFCHKDKVYEVVRITRQGSVHPEFCHKYSVGEAIAIAIKVSRSNLYKPEIRLPLGEVSKRIRRVRKEIIRNCG